ncbi:hypothetical protein AVEN_87941-1 [Araneus ventricosus]|uniref:Uncharacterized protein n=1 Tax=Araneus ventricosus TaxID=182803 RepID=A0A4Y2VLZ9_ARAVE|nr:hypothetical protein AVEN_269943-1 [Araneus ventricosus]GBO26382.1 hypothetical protein AVEN_15804-1 [Araneus ventricosus]GBO26383.1 hypothetical protein AVEN_127297-1 [Araneus ventricosus]GBO26530.1 hypothetical protein AVEN_87941-1 [Araneus ventricosus]
MNITEDIWDALLHVVEKRSPPPRTSMDLLIALQDSWCEFPPGYLQTLVESMAHRFESLLSGHGSRHDLKKVHQFFWLFHVLISGENFEERRFIFVLHMEYFSSS